MHIVERIVYNTTHAHTHTHTHDQGSRHFANTASLGLTKAVVLSVLRRG